MKLIISKNLDIMKFSVKFSFAESSYTVTRNGAGTAADPYYYEPQTAGQLRIWTKNGSEARMKTEVTANTTPGNRVPSDVAIPLNKLFSGTASGDYLETTLYVEAVNPSASSGGNTITASLYKNDDTTAPMLSDSVKTTEIQIILEAVNVKDDSGLLKNPSGIPKDEMAKFFVETRPVDLLVCKEDSVMFFNPTLQVRREFYRPNFPSGTSSVECLTPEIPPLGYALVPKKNLSPVPLSREKTLVPPKIENVFYRVRFSENGAIDSIFDKELGRELLDRGGSAYHANEFVFTEDNHKTFATPEKATFDIIRSPFAVTVVSRMNESVSGAELVQKLTLPSHEKRIDLDNSLLHVKSMINRNRYYRYGYYAFPFHLENTIRYAHLSNCTAEDASGRTGHGTDTYFAAREWSCAENAECGVALLQMDSQLVEFGRIHSDKTDCGRPEPGAAIYAYLMNDWLQMHLPGGSHANFRFRFSIVSYSGNYRSAGISELAERFENPLFAISVSPHDGTLPSFHSFLNPVEKLRLLTLKRADDGNGLILRLQENRGESFVCNFQALPFCADAVTPCTPDERISGNHSLCVRKWSPLTLRLTGQALNLSVRPIEQPAVTEGGLTPIGSVYTGLITKPHAINGEKRGELYLIWGQNVESYLSHYELYRSESPVFIPDASTFLAKVDPGPYRVGLYIDEGLKDHTRYFYRIRAVTKDGVFGPFSGTFCGLTRETFADELTDGL